MAEPARPGRILSLDWVRGLMLCASILSASVFLTRPDYLVHAVWDEGPTLVDWIFPVFVALSGCGLAFAYRNRIGWPRTIRRVVVLLVAGISYNVVVAWAGGTLGEDPVAVTGPLTLYAVLVLAIAVPHRVLRTWRAWLVASLALAGLHTALLWLWAQGCPGDVLTRACNPSGTVDSALLGTHMYRGGAAGHDPEGLIAIAGAICSAACGATIGHLLVQLRGERASKLLLRAGACVAIWFAAAAALELLVPNMKRLWTAPFALGCGAWVAVALVLGSLLVDRTRPARWKTALMYPHVAMGRNSLLMYFGSHLLMAVLILRTIGGERVIDRVAAPVTRAAHVQLDWSILLLVAFAVTAMVLHRFRIYLRP